MSFKSMTSQPIRIFSDLSNLSSFVALGPGSWWVLIHNVHSTNYISDRKFTFDFEFIVVVWKSHKMSKLVHNGTGTLWNQYRKNSGTFTIFYSGYRFVPLIYLEFQIMESFVLYCSAYKFPSNCGVKLMHFFCYLTSLCRWNFSVKYH